MRIISGKRRGLRLATVGHGDSAAHLRPTSDRVRENVFNLLLGGEHGNPIANARVLDLFAGTGALGLEAWSRGAAQVVFVDNASRALALIRQNIELCRAQETTHVHRRDVTRLGICQAAPFDLVFLDPPYGKGLGEKALASALAGGWLAADSLIILEEGKPLPPPVGFRQIDQRRYGNTTLHILQQERAP